MSQSWHFWQKSNVRGLGTVPICVRVKRHFYVCVCVSRIPPLHCGSRGNECHVLVLFWPCFHLLHCHLLLSCSCLDVLYLSCPVLLCVFALSFLVLTFAANSDCKIDLRYTCMPVFYKLLEYLTFITEFPMINNMLSFHPCVLPISPTCHNVICRLGCAHHHRPEVDSRTRGYRRCSVWLWGWECNLGGMYTEPRSQGW